MIYSGPQKNSYGELTQEITQHINGFATLKWLHLSQKLKVPCLCSDPLWYLCFKLCISLIPSMIKWTLRKMTDELQFCSIQLMMALGGGCGNFRSTGRRFGFPQVLLRLGQGTEKCFWCTWPCCSIHNSIPQSCPVGYQCRCCNIHPASADTW